MDEADDFKFPNSILIRSTKETWYEAQQKAEQ